METVQESTRKVPEFLRMKKPVERPMEKPCLLYLGGGGSAEDEANVWHEVFQPGQRIVIWPFALPPQRWPGILDWFTGALAAQWKLLSGLKSGSITLSDAVPGGGLEDADVVVVPGGNTFELLETLRNHNLLNKLIQFINDGGRYYGGSAGALLVGADIGLCDVERGGLDDNTVGLRDTQGLRLMGDICVYPHWEQPITGTGYEVWAKENGLRVLCMPEKSGVVVDTRKKIGWNKGPENVIIFSPDGQNVIIKAEESFTF